MAEKGRSQKQLFHEPLMKKRRKQIDSENIVNKNNWIPEEIVFSILQKLPGKSLVRFKCINKSSNSIISDPSFLNKNHKIILCDFNSIFLMSYKESESRAEAKRLHLPTKIKPRLVEVRASCNGILWILVNVEEHILWNPFTSESKIMLIAPHIARIFEGHLGDDTWYPCGFGYNHVTKDYQIICIPGGRWKPFIYSVAKDSCESLEDNIPLRSWYCVNKIGISMKSGSVVYWLEQNFVEGRQRGHSNPLIVGFDFVNRRKQIIDTWLYKERYDHTDCKLMDFKGSLCVVKTDRMQQIREMWLYKEEMDREKHWEMLMSIDLAGFSWGLPIYIMRDEVLIDSKDYYTTEGRKTKFYAYNSAEKGFQIVKVRGVKHWCQDLNYIETLTSIQN